MNFTDFLLPLAYTNALKTYHAFLAKQKTPAAFPLVLRLENTFSRVHHTLTSTSFIQLPMIPVLLHVFNQHVILHRLFRSSGFY